MAVQSKVFGNRFVNFNEAGVTKLLHGKGSEIRQFIEEITKEVEKRARIEAPSHDKYHHEGTITVGGTKGYSGPPLRNTISSEVRDTEKGVIGIVRATSPKARPVHEGTPGHFITRKVEGKPLVFYASGSESSIRFVWPKKGQLYAQVWNPGIKPKSSSKDLKPGTYNPRGANPFLARALAEVWRERRFDKP